MIVLKHNDTVYIARSCWTIRDPEARRVGVPDRENLSMWHPKKKRNRLVAVSCCGRFADLIRYEDVFPSTLDGKHLVFESYDKMYAIADRFGLCERSVLPARTVFAEDDRAFILYGDGGHIELENIYAGGCADEVVMALYDLKGVKDPYEFFRDAFRTIEDMRKYVMFPVVVMNTKNNRIELIDR